MYTHIYIHLYLSQVIFNNFLASSPQQHKRSFNNEFNSINISRCNPLGYKKKKKKKNVRWTTNTIASICIGNHMITKAI